VILVVLVLLHGIAIAGPSRVVVADPDPELRRAIESALRPWKIEVVVEPAAPADETQARANADASRAQFVVWRSAADLVVYDRQRDASDRRPSRLGSLDPVTAATVALTVKTLLRLPPLDPVTTDAPAATASAPSSVDAGTGFGVEAGGALRVAHGSETDVGGRASLALRIQPARSLGLRLALAGDVGTTTDVNHAGFKGTATDWAVLGGVGWRFPTGAWELEPELGLGLQRSSLAGTETSGTQRDEHAISAVVRGAVAVRRRLGRWTMGAAVGVDAFLGTPTYTRSTGPTIYDAPTFAMVLGLLVGAEIDR